MTSDDEAARKARAESLRAQIRRITGSGPDTSADAEKQSSEGEASRQDDDSQTSADISPREFIHKRMRELSKGKK